MILAHEDKVAARVQAIVPGSQLEVERAPSAGLGASVGAGGARNPLLGLLGHGNIHNCFCKLAAAALPH